MGSDRVKSALFVDFDNIFQGLFDDDRDVARAFARKPDAWLERLATAGMESGVSRQFLIRRCYLNPQGAPSVAREGGGKARDPMITYGTFRGAFTRAGFEVIDCPSLTNSQKNAADIRIALDVLELALLGTPCEEFVLASGDSDFTPLLHRLSARDKRSLLVASGPVAAACKAAATQYLDGAATVELIRPVRRATDRRVAAPPAGLESAGLEPAALEPAGLEPAALEPAGLESAGLESAGLESAGLESAGLGLAATEPGELGSGGAASEAAVVDDPPADALRRAGLPVGDAMSWQALSVTMAESIGVAAPFVGLVTRTCRDALHAGGVDWSRHVVNDILQVCRRGGISLHEPVAPSPESVLQALLQGVVVDGVHKGFVLSPTTVLELGRHLGVVGTNAPASDDSVDSRAESVPAATTATPAPLQVAVYHPAPSTPLLAPGDALPPPLPPPFVDSMAAC